MISSILATSHRTRHHEVQSLPPGTWRGGVVLAFCLSLWMPSSSQGSDVSLAFLKAVHVSSRQLLRSGSCHIEFKLTYTPADGSAAVHQGCSGDYWFSDGGVRLRVHDEQQGDVDRVWKDSVRTGLYRRQSSGRPVVGADIDRSATPFTHRCDVFARGLLALHVPGTVVYVVFERLVEKASEVGDVYRLKTEHGDLLAVELTFEYTVLNHTRTTVVEIAFDPKVNYLVRRAVYVTDGQLKKVYVVEQFKECSPGVFFPERVREATYLGRNQIGTALTEISRIRINYAVPDSIFRLKFPHGVYVSDSIRGTSYRVDREGNRISAETPLSKGPPPPAAAEIMLPTTEEPRPWYSYLVPASLAILVAAGIAAVVRRWRRHRQAA